ncbi:hypothetical protein PVAG01_09527 [Phlyctema vagabunda]|uniref:DUF4231 domain-containing protein n=1 Tax=Phlyctema vagabunda TaxID=108571 RepID=A0ABR4P7L9_9HELO
MAHRNSLLPDPYYLTARFWKRFSVFATVALSIAALVVSAIVQLRADSPTATRALMIAGVVINSVSISLSALTSLDWKKQLTHDRALVDQLNRAVGIRDTDRSRLGTHGQVEFFAKEE